MSHENVGYVSIVPGWKDLRFWSGDVPRYPTTHKESGQQGQARDKKKRQRRKERDSQTARGNIDEWLQPRT